MRTRCDNGDANSTKKGTLGVCLGPRQHADQVNHKRYVGIVVASTAIIRWQVERQVKGMEDLRREFVRTAQVSLLGA